MPLPRANAAIAVLSDGCDRGLRPNRSWLLSDLPGKGVFTRPRPAADIPRNT